MESKQAEAAARQTITEAAKAAIAGKLAEMEVEGTLPLANWAAEPAPLSPPPSASESNAQNRWLNRLKGVAPEVSEADLEAAAAKLNAQYSDSPVPVAVEAPEGQCPVCGGQGAVKVNPEAQPDDPEFGRVSPCPSAFHTDQRLKKLAKISNLSEKELEIRLSDCAVYHNPKEEYTFEKIKMPDPKQDGKLVALTLPCSNREMLRTFRTLAKEPYGQAGMIFVIGRWGNGKTQGSMGLVNEINLNGKGPAMYITLLDLLEFLKAAYDDRNRRDEEFGDWSYDHRYQAVARAKVIVVDEFDLSDNKVKDTQANLQFLHRWVNDRYRSGIYNQTLTILVSNSPIENMGLDGVTSRMADGRFRTIFNTAPDFRPAQGGKG